MGVSPPGTVPPSDGHRWVELIDDAGDRWLFDATFLLSGYHCIYGNGCQSIDTEPDHTNTLGCCIHGAHFVDEEDLADVAAYAALLTDDDWQHRRRAIAKGGPFKQKGKKNSKKNSKKKPGDWVTRKVDGACIFLNRADFPGGQGCALHAAALRRGERPVDWKPDVCWQVPIRLDVHTDDYENDTVFVRAWERRDWGPGGDDFNWWCTEQPEAFTNPAPVYQTSRHELELLVGEDLYRRLVALLEEVQLEAELRQREVPVELGVKSS